MRTNIYINIYLVVPWGCTLKIKLGQKDSNI